MSWRRRPFDYGEFVPAVHYSWGSGSFCGTERAKINGTLLTNNKDEVTCKNCLKKFTGKKFLKDSDKHFDKELFEI